MITICIPVYNIDVASLANELYNQAEILNIQYEIVIIDDFSDKFKEKNKNNCKKFNYIELPYNIGRAKIRNLFLKYSKYEYLLFIDCDSTIESSNFLSKYIEIINKESPSVVCGGSVYSKNKPIRNKMLRWKYGILRESKPAEIRQKNPRKSFMTNNFLIEKKILEKIKFDERIKKYGHEDTLFGFSLKKANINISHIDNPVLNGNIESNTEYIDKTTESINNLVNIVNYMDNDQDLINDITILKFYNKIKKVENIIYLPFLVLKPFIVLLLTRGYINLYLFDYFKLGIYIQNIKNNN